MSFIHFYILRLFRFDVLVLNFVVIVLFLHLLTRRNGQQPDEFVVARAARAFRRIIVSSHVTGGRAPDTDLVLTITGAVTIHRFHFCPLPGSCAAESVTESATESAADSDADSDNQSVGLSIWRQFDDTHSHTRTSTAHLNPHYQFTAKQ